MKKAYKILFIFLLPLMIEVMVACCDCQESTFFNYTNCSLSVMNLDNSGESPVITQSNTLSKKAYGIKIIVSRKEELCEIRKNNSFLIPSANAIYCDCPPEFQYLPLDSIVSVTISTLNDFDSDHQASSDVTELFYVFEHRNFSGISEYIENMDNILYDFMRPDFELTLLLMSPPTIGIEHQFEISIALSDDRTLETTTEKVGLI